MRDAAEPLPGAAVAGRVLGIDPGLAITGWAVLEGEAHRPRLLASGVLRTRPRDPRPVRLHLIARGLAALMAEHSPAEVAVEQQFVAENVRTAMAIGEARAAALIAAAGAGLPVFEYAPTAVKEAVTGYGGAPKEQLREMVMLQLELAEPPSPLDVSDAMAIALTRLADARLDARLAASGASSASANRRAR
jgi:crossover junction endodeoxyribonuclease RuvC